MYKRMLIDMSKIRLLFSSYSSCIRGSEASNFDVVTYKYRKVDTEKTVMQKKETNEQFILLLVVRA